ncbi:MAG: DegT/DnrJ/EryC1/StrS family aminotransferase [Lachnospiraceae bacterium]|nr:DegT/DnrJ/EryC1/StrS family aminotransferase [Lachnospiraceae bacterium]
MNAVDIPVMNVNRQYAQIQGELDTVALEILHGGQYILGEKVDNFEKAFAAYCGSRYAIGVGNGSDALVIALKACGIRPGDEVITTDMSFIATAEAIIAVGAIPVFADCTPDTYTIDPCEIEKKVTERTRAILPVHIYGQCADMDAICNIAKKHGLAVIEDAAQATGATYKGRCAGSIGNAGCFSFFPTKNLGCCGDGGMILTNDENIYRQCKAMRVHGSGKDALFTYGLWNGKEIDIDKIDFGGNLPKYYNYIDGYNSRLDAIQAGILHTKLKYLDDWNNRRREIARRYDSEIINPLITKPFVAEENEHVFYVYTISTQRRDELRAYLKSNGIVSGVYFPVPFHKQMVFENLKCVSDAYPNAEFTAEHTLVLPMFPELTQDEVDRIISTVNGWKP